MLKRNVSLKKYLRGLLITTTCLIAIIVFSIVLVPVLVSATTYGVVEFSPGSSTEQTYWYETNHSQGFEGGLCHHPTNFRLAQREEPIGTNCFFTYKFTQPVGTNAMLTLTLSYQYLVKVSTDNSTWTTVLDYDTLGVWMDERTVDLTPYYASSTNVYVRFEDKDYSDGWGAGLWHVKLQTTSASNTPHTMKIDVSNTWSVSIDGGAPVTKNAGDTISMSATSTATCTKSVSVPTWWSGLSKTLSFSGVDGTASLYVNNVLRSSNKEESQPFSISISDSEISSGTVDIKVIITKNAGQTGTITVGLWNPVQIGLTELVQNKQVAQRSLASNIVKVNRQYFTDTMDDVNIYNWLAGNFTQSIYSDYLSLLNFNNYYNLDAFSSWYHSQAKYVHDSLRDFAGLVEEERYSPVCRLDLIKRLYLGLKKARVPGSTWEFFGKWDARPLTFQNSQVNSKYIELMSEWDNPGYICDTHFYAKKTDTSYFDAADCTVSDSSLNFSASTGQYDYTRTYTAPGGSPTVTAAIKYFEANRDKPSEVKFTNSSGLTELRAVVENFDKRWSGSRFPLVETPSRTVYNATSGNVDISNPTFNYIILKEASSGWIRSFAVTWSGSPSRIVVNRYYIDGIWIYGKIDIYYSSWSSGITTKIIPFEHFDSNMNWQHSCASNVVNYGIYGANGFDPSFNCNIEGLGPFICGAAYILNKYGDPLASDAITFGKQVVDGAYDADVNRGMSSPILTGNIAGAEYLYAAGQSGYDQKVRFWADRLVSSQAQDGTWPYLDQQVRHLLALIRAYRCTGDSTYLTSINNGRNALTYSDSGVTFKGVLYKPGFAFGGGDLGILGYLGDWTAIHQNMVHINKNYMSDAGVWPTSDLNPYAQGISLKSAGLLDYFPDKKYLLKLNEYVKYDRYNGITVQKSPTAVQDNPEYAKVDTAEAAIALTNVNLQGGINLGSVSDGDTTYESSIGGETCRRTTPSTGDYYIYFNVKDSFLFGSYTSPMIAINVRYYDSGSDSLAVEYYDTSSTLKTVRWNKHNTGAWKERIVILDNYKFDNSLGASDFRVSDLADGADYVTNVKVTKLLGDNTYESEDLFAQTGAIVSDGSASGGKARKAANGTDSTGYMQFGPYTYYQDIGEYTATFRMKVANKTSSSVIATIDVINSDTGEVVNSKSIKPSDFTSASTYQDFSIKINGAHCYKYEYRVYWNSGITDLYVDKVTTQRVQTKGLVYDENNTYSQTGSTVADMYAFREHARKAVAGSDSSAYLQYGPYETNELATGSRTAHFRLKVSDNSSANVVATVDAYNSVSGVVATRDIRGSDFSKSNLYEVFDLSFTKPTSGTMEFRVHWKGNVTLSLDQIVIE